MDWKISFVRCQHFGLNEIEENRKYQSMLHSMGKYCILKFCFIYICVCHWLVIEKIPLTMSHNPKRYESHCLRDSTLPNQKVLLLPLVHSPVLESTVCSDDRELNQWGKASRTSWEKLPYKTKERRAHQSTGCLLPVQTHRVWSLAPLTLGSLFLHLGRTLPGSLPSSWGLLFFLCSPINSTAFQNYPETDSLTELLRFLRRKRNHFNFFH